MSRDQQIRKKKKIFRKKLEKTRVFQKKMGKLSFI
jgi:hypothetical protein